jgi:AcrR family transcriptional regulator
VRSKSPQQADKILAAAARLFASHRFHEARMDDIAALAEVGKGTLYRYFKDKEELYLALLDRAAASLQARLCRCLQPADPPRRQLVAAVAGLISYFDDEPHVLELIIHAEALQRPGGAFPWQKTREQTMGLIKGLFEAGQRQGVFAVADPDLATFMLLGGLRAVIRFGKTPRAPGLAEEIVCRFLDGFGHAEAAPPPRGQRSVPRAAAPAGQVVDAAVSSFHNAGTTAPMR